MRVAMMHKTDARSEAGLPPNPEMIAAVGRLVEEMTKAGVFREGEGLHRTSKGVRLKFVAGERTITPGPFLGSNELPAGFCIVRVNSIDEAIEWSTRFAAVVGDVEMDIRPIVEPWQIGLCSEPEVDGPVRFMLMHKADASTEAGLPPSPELMARMGTLMEELGKAGVFVTAGGFQPSSKGVRMRYTGGKPTVTDGPFTESKELIAGYCIADVATMDEAIGWATRFAAVVGDVEMDIRPFHEACSPA